MRRSPFASGPLYRRLTAVVLGAVFLCGAAVHALHTVALGRAITPFRLESLRLLADETLKRRALGVAASVPAPYTTAIFGADGSLREGDPPPPWVRGFAGVSGERCRPLGGACFAARPLPGGETLLVYPLPRSLIGPLTLALLGSIVVWLAISALAGVLLLRAMRRADASRRRLLAALAHDLGTPLTSIRGFAETLLASPAEGDRRGWTIVYREALRMQRLVEDMLALSSLEAGKLSLVRRRFDLRELLHSATERAAMAHGEAPLLTLPDAPVEIEADRDRIEQAVANVVDNAYRHGGGRDVRVGLTSSDGRARVEVSDDGPGLSSAARARLFEPFAHGDGAKGSGLGLAVAREIAARHGGELTLSDPPGCRATLVLPA